MYKADELQSVNEFKFGAITMRAVVLSIVVMIVLSPLLIGQVFPDEPNKVGVFMRAKLQHSQRVLEGLTTENYEMIAKHSQEMSLLSQASTWQVLQTVEYRERSTEFHRSVDALTEAAKKKQLDAAALAYVDVTLKCVSCHKYVRTVGPVRAPGNK